MRITLNLATRPYADQGPAIKRLRMGMAALAVVLIGLALGLMHFHQSAERMRAQEDDLDRQIAQIKHEEQGYEAQMEQPANAKVLTQAQFLNSLFDEKSFSWTAAMEDMERVLPGGVQVTSLEPARDKEGRLTLKLRVSGQRERAVELVRNMEHSRRFASPRISGENAENTSQGDLQPVKDSGRVSFDILAEYNPATLDERKAEIAHQKHFHAPPAGAVPQATRPAYRAPQNGLPLAQPAIPPGRQGPLTPQSVQPRGTQRSHGFGTNAPPGMGYPNPTGGPQ